MTFRESRIIPIAFWLAFLALGFVTSFAGPPHSPGSTGEVVAAREAGEKSAQE